MFGCDVDAHHEEGCSALCVGRVQHGTVGQHHPHVLQRVVSVLCHSAAHARRVVADNAAHHAGVDGGRVGSNLVLQRRAAWQ